MLAIIDGDIVAYRCSASTENDTEDVAILRVDVMMNDILNDTGSDFYKTFLTGKNNFRYELYSEYKANRRDKPKPRWLQACRDFLVAEWAAEISDGCEADDLIGITASAQENMMSHVVCSIDKDLKQIPGHHYNFVTKAKEFVSPIEGYKYFYKQLILGDASDNIPGFDGKARQKWPKFMQHHHDAIDMCSCPEDMYDYVRNIYSNEANNIIINGRLLHIQRYAGEMWIPPNLQIEVRGESSETIT
jgi:DNA polymerase-1